MFNLRVISRRELEEKLRRAQVSERERRAVLAGDETFCGEGGLWTIEPSERDTAPGQAPTQGFPPPAIVVRSGPEASRRFDEAYRRVHGCAAPRPADFPSLLGAYNAPPRPRPQPKPRPRQDSPEFAEAVADAVERAMRRPAWE
jgi:hypothetical protein